MPLGRDRRVAARGERGAAGERVLDVLQLLTEEAVEGVPAAERVEATGGSLRSQIDIKDVIYTTLCNSM